jgi:hypothetical protein
VHALFFNYQPAVYLITATKVAHIGVAGPVSHRRGPQLNSGLIWDAGTTAWIEQDSADDGFTSVADEAKDEATPTCSNAAQPTLAALQVLPAMVVLPT